MLINEVCEGFNSTRKCTILNVQFYSVCTFVFKAKIYHPLSFSHHPSGVVQREGSPQPLMGYGCHDDEATPTILRGHQIDQ